jgi:2-polyprenyl-3-methyl-5-hydroxy-6-metoxy-1,4-benzoquinol methylase
VNRGVAIDLGAGCGFQSVPLAEAGFKVTAVDFCQPLLDEILVRAPAAGIATVTGDLMHFTVWAGHTPELITCMGDTLTHLPNNDSVCDLIRKCHAELVPGGKLILSLRDYSGEPAGTVRVVPVQRDGLRIFLCRLEYLQNHIRVTDILYSRISGRWVRSAGEYAKLRLAQDHVREMMEETGFRIECMAIEHGMNMLIGVKPD